MFCKCGCVVLPSCRCRSTFAVGFMGGTGLAETMDMKGKERGILKAEPRPRASESKSELAPQGFWEKSPASPQPSVDRLSVTWADPDPCSMTSSVNLYHLPSEPTSEAKFSPTVGEGSEDEDYSASLSAVLRQRRASVRRSRKGRARRPSSPFLSDEPRPRRRSSVFTTSSGDTAISMEESQPAVVTQEQIFENIHLHKEVLGSVKQQPLGMRRKLKIVHQAKAYIKRHEGQLQERLAQSKSTRDIYARFNILLATKWQQMKREAANTSNLLIPWELRIKEIESHFGSVVASYFTFLRWLFWVNLVIAFILLVFVIVPEYLTGNPQQDGERKIILEEERRNATNLLTLWEFEGILKVSPIFYGYYSNVERPEYRMPLAYFLTGLVVYIYSFVAILRKMAENSRMSKLSEKEDACIFSWKLFTGWDFMIGNAETAHNRIASVILGFKEALLEEAEKKKDVRNWRIISLRALVNIGVVILLAVSAFAVVTVVSRSDDNTKTRNWWRENETTIVVTVISITFPVFFELLGLLEHYHPRKQLRLQLARIMLLNLLNLYSLIFALFSKIDGMSKDLDTLKPTLTMNASMLPNSTLIINESLALNVPMTCFEVRVPCTPCNITLVTLPPAITKSQRTTTPTINTKVHQTTPVLPPNLLKANFIMSVIPKSSSLNMRSTLKPQKSNVHSKKFLPQNLIEKKLDYETTTEDPVKVQLAKLHSQFNISSVSAENSSESNEDGEINYYDEVITTENDENDFTSTLTSLDFNYSHSTDSTVTNDDYGEEFSKDVINITDTIVTEYFNSSTETESAFHVTDFSTTTGSDITVTETDTTFTDPNYFMSTSEAYISTEKPVSDSTSKSTNIDSTLSINVVSSSYTPHTDATTSQKEDEMEILSDKSLSVSTLVYSEATLDVSTVAVETVTVCPNITFNCTTDCKGKNVTQMFFISNCTLVEKQCFIRECHLKTNITTIDMVYIDEHKRRLYNLTVATKKKLLKLCWETMFGQELVKLTMMDLVFVLLGTLFMDFFRALFVRYMNRCWCWDLEKKCPKYGDFKIAENILHLINNQGMVWMGMFFSPGLVVLNVSKLMIMMYLRSWAVMTCNVPHEVVFRVSKSNNFYLALLLTMLFLCVLPVGYSIVWVKPSWHCGPFSEYDKIYYILTSNIYKIFPEGLNFALKYIASPAIVIPLLVLLILIIYYLTSLTNSLREANNDLKIQLRRERTEERRKMFQLADTRRAGTSALDNTPFARWKKALPALPLNKSIDSDDKKTISGEERSEPVKATKKRGGLLAKIVGLALDKKPGEIVSDDIPPSPNNVDEETDTDFHETLPKEILKIKDIIIKTDFKKKNNVEFKTEVEEAKRKDNLKVKLDKIERSEKRPESKEVTPTAEDTRDSEDSKLERDQTVDSVTSKQSDSFGSVIPVITISTTESDDEVSKKTNSKRQDRKIKSKNGSEMKSLQRQSSVDSANDQKSPKEKKSEDGHKFQYSL